MPQHFPNPDDDDAEPPLLREPPPPPGYESPVDTSPLLDHLEADVDDDVAEGESP